MSAIAKGVRKAKSRFGGRLEPFFRLDLVLYEGRSDLLTVTIAPRRVAAHPRLREHGGALDGAARACEAVAPHVRRRRPARAASTTCSPTSSRCSTATRRAPTRANALAFRLKLLLAAGFAPQLAGCASCGEREHLVGFSGAAGGVVCGACEASAFPLDEEAHDFMVAALGRPLAETPDAVAARAGPGRARDHRDARAPRPPAAAPRRLALTALRRRSHRRGARPRAPFVRLAYRLRAIAVPRRPARRRRSPPSRASRRRDHDVPLPVGQARLRVLLRRRDPAARCAATGRAATTSAIVARRDRQGAGAIKITDTVIEPEGEGARLRQQHEVRAAASARRAGRHHLPEHELAATASGCPSRSSEVF